MSFELAEDQARGRRRWGLEEAWTCPFKDRRSDLERVEPVQGAQNVYNSRAMVICGASERERPDGAYSEEQRGAGRNKTLFHCLLFISLWSLFPPQQLYFLVSKPLGFVPVMTLHFVEGVLVSFQCLSVLLLRCLPAHEHLLDRFKRIAVPHFC